MNAFSIQVGCEVSAFCERYVIRQIIGPAQVLAGHCETGTLKVLNTEHLGPPIAPEPPPSIADPDVMNLDPAEWAYAMERGEALRPYLRPNKLTQATAKKLAAKLNTSTATVYRLRKRLETFGKITVLMPGHRVRRRRKPRLTPEVEAIITKVIEEKYLSRQKRKPGAIVDEVRRICSRARLPVPAGNSVRKRIAAVAEEVAMTKREGHSEARNKRLISKGPFPGADGPMAVVQIDHTPLDILVVDEETRTHTFKPKLTMAVDVFSRAIVGFVLSLKDPNADTVGQCIIHSALPKREWLESLGLDDLDWPMFGMPAKIFTDNAQVFHSESLRRSCQQRGIHLEYRRPGKPSDAGHVERLFRTINQKVHELPGATFSNPKHRGTYKSEKEASLTLRALTEWLVRWIVGEYHNKVHDGINTTPHAKWEEGFTGGRTGLGKPPMKVADAERFKIDLLPSDRRTVQSYGVRVSHLNYTCDELSAYRRLDEQRKYVIRFDPDNAKFIYLYIDKEDDYLRLTCSNLATPVATFEELNEVRRELRADGHKRVSPELMHAQLERRNSIVAEQQELTKRERRRQEQAKHRKTSEKLRPRHEANGSVSSVPLDGEVSQMEVADIRPFETEDM